MPVVFDLLKALGLAMLVYAVTVGGILLMDEIVPMWLAFAPGFAIQGLLEYMGLDLTNRVAVTSTLLFWWAVFWALLTVRRSRSRRRVTTQRRGDAEH
jgi:hypothetical protein